MSYSNINKDNAQAGKGRKLGAAAITTVLLLVMISSGINVYNQWTTLRQAEERNREMKSKIDKLETENKIMEKQVAEATESAYIERKIREYTGYGGSDDYWLIMPEDEIKEISKTDEKEKEVIIVRQWWNLFFR